MNKSLRYSLGRKDNQICYPLKEKLIVWFEDDLASKLNLSSQKNVNSSMLVLSNVFYNCGRYRTYW